LAFAYADTIFAESADSLRIKTDVR